MLKDVDVPCHSSIKIKKDKVIYIDPFKIEENSYDADFIFITHDHYDHFSEADIEKIRKEDTMIILPESAVRKAIELNFISNNIITVVPDRDYTVLGISFSTIPAYNIGKEFHPKDNKWVGYILQIDDIKYYIAGDTDITEENKKVECDIAFLPIGGTYTMNAEEAAQLAKYINPKIVVPTHYASIVGTKEDAERFCELLNKEIECEILIK